MSAALVGYTGFVGGNLRQQTSFDAVYNSKNIEELAGKRFDRLVCAGAPAAKWIANRDPEGDKAGLARLMSALDAARIDELILISTIDVYPSLDGADEETAIDATKHHAYGRHRYELEEFVRNRFPCHLVVRLPGLFGTGIKKNAIFDFLNDNDVHKIHSRACYQFYGLDTIWDDIETARDAGLGLVNLFTEPVAIHEVCRQAFGLEFDNDPGYPAPSYDARTVHSDLYGGSGGYIVRKEQVLEQIAAFVARERAGEASR